MMREVVRLFVLGVVVCAMVLPCQGADHTYAYETWAIDMGKGLGGRRNPSSGLTAKVVGPDTVRAGERVVFRVYLLPEGWSDTEQADAALRAQHNSVTKMPHIYFAPLAREPIGFPAVVMVTEKGAVEVSDDPTHYAWMPYSKQAVSEEVRGTGTYGAYAQGWRRLRQLRKWESLMGQLLEEAGKAYLETQGVGIILRINDLIQSVSPLTNPSAIEQYRETHDVLPFPLLANLVLPHPRETAHRIDVPLVFNKSGNVQIRFFVNARLKAGPPDFAGSGDLAKGANLPVTVRLQEAWASSGRIAFVRNRDGDMEIYVMNADGTGQRQLISNSNDDWDPAYSPDGRRIAFVRWRDGDPEIYVMNADGSRQRQLTSNSACDRSPAWSPDGRRIAFVSDRDGNEEIYVMNADGSGQRRLTSNSQEDLSPAWSPDGRRIAFARARDELGDYEIYVMNADGSGQRRLTTNSAWNCAPAWSPDGRRIAFVSALHHNDEIYVMNANGSGQRRLTNNPVYDASPAWSPDGTRIAFTRDLDHNSQIYVMNADGSGQRRLTYNSANDFSPAWCPVP